MLCGPPILKPGTLSLLRNNNMKPFNLEAAKNGAPIQFRDGSPATFLAHYPQLHSSCRVVVANKSGGLFVRHENGAVYENSYTHEVDLVMAPVAKTYYYAIVLDKNKQLQTTSMSLDKSSLEEMCRTCYRKTLEIRTFTHTEV